MNQAAWRMDGKRVLVTGAASGIGKATAIQFAKSGALLALVDRSEEELEKLLKRLGGEEAGHFLVRADVSDVEEMMSAYQQVGNHWNDLDVVVANAGVNGVWAPLDQIHVDEWDQTMAINLLGTFLTVKLALPFLRKRGGAVVVISSINGNRIFSNSGATAYACSKAAQVAFAKMTALEFAKDQIRVNVVCPGAIRTHIDESTDLRGVEGLHLPVEFPEGDVPLNEGRPGSAEDVAKAVWYLASDLASHVSGTELYVDGAQSLLQG